MSVIQYVTPRLSIPDFSKLRFKLEKSRVYYDNNDANITKITRLILKGFNKPIDIVLIAFFQDFGFLIDLHMRFKAKFRFIIRTAFPVDTVYHNYITTVFDYKSSNNTFFFREITPSYDEIDNIIRNLVSKLHRFVRGEIVVLGGKHEIVDFKDRSGKTVRKLYFRNNPYNVPDNVRLVIETMLDINNNYLGLGQSLENYFSFSGVIYYRLMAKHNFEHLSLTRNSQHVNHLKSLLASTPLSEINKLKFFNYKLSDLPDYALPFCFAEFELKEILPLYLVKGLGYIITHQNSLINIIDYYNTEDISYNKDNNDRIRVALSNVFGYGINFYLNLLAEYFTLEVRERKKFCYINRINYATMTKISEFLKGTENYDNPTKDVKSRAIELIRNFYNEVYPSLRLSSDNKSYTDNNYRYKIDKNFTLQSNKREKSITPIVFSRFTEQNNNNEIIETPDIDFVVYLYISDDLNVLE